MTETETTAETKAEIKTKACFETVTEIYIKVMRAKTKTETETYWDCNQDKQRKYEKI